MSHDDQERPRHELVTVTYCSACSDWGSYWGDHERRLLNGFGCNVPWEDVARRSMTGGGRRCDDSYRPDSMMRIGLCCVRCPSSDSPDIEVPRGLPLALAIFICLFHGHTLVLVSARQCSSNFAGERTVWSIDLIETNRRIHIAARSTNQPFKADMCRTLQARNERTRQPNVVWLVKDTGAMSSKSK